MKSKLVGLILVLAGGLSFYFISLPDLNMAQESAGWPKVSGTITHSDVRRVETGHGADKKVSYRPEIRYSYQVEGKEYQGVKIHITEGSSYSYRIAGKIGSRYPEGAEVEVSYRPEDPAYALLESGIRAPEIMVAAFMLLFALLGLLLMFKVIKPDSKKQVSGRAVLLLAIYLCCLPACEEKGIDPDKQTDVLEEGEDITMTAMVTPCGKTLELEDENGTFLRVTFPPVAVSDSIEVTLHWTGEVEEQALENRHIRSFELLPADMILYEPIDIYLIFKDIPGSLDAGGIYRVPSQGQLQALSDLACSDSGDTISASSVRAGFFTEGEISTDEILRQMDLILEVYEIQAKGSHVISNAADDIAAAWGDIHADIESYLGFMKALEDYYEDHPEEKEAHQEKLCEVVCKGVEMILEMPVPPEDPCGRAYIQTVGDMLKAMNLLGCDGCQSFTDAGNRFSQIIRDCKSFLEMEMDFEGEYEWGSVSQHDGGLITLSARFDEYGVVVVEGTGEMVITGEMESGDCTGLIIGSSTVFIYGYRDADYNYTVEILAEDEGSYYITCPDGGYTQPFTSTPTEVEAELNPGNDFTWDKDYPIEGGGNMHVYVKMFNPWVNMTDN